MNEGQILCVVYKTRLVINVRCCARLEGAVMQDSREWWLHSCEITVRVCVCVMLCLQTSLLSILGGRAPAKLKLSGSVTVNGSKLNKLTRRRIGFVLQVR